MLIFLDLETTGLDSEKDQITEIAAITEDHRVFHRIVEHTVLPNDWVIRSTDYVERILLGAKMSADIVKVEFFEWVYAAEPNHIVGANPSFDDRFIRKWFYPHDPPYHYHLVDIEAVAMGKLGLKKPPKLKEIRGLLGVPGQNENPHTALSDAEEVKFLWEQMQG